MGIPYYYKDHNENLYGDDLGIYQTNIQRQLFLFGILLVPILLFAKPLLIYIKNKRKKNNDYELLDNVNNNTTFFYKIKEEEDFSEIFIHQLIETIEFLLGSVSNTASYLRLWALSLAHSQLSKVFLEMTIVNQIKNGNIIGVVVTLPIFFIATILVLFIMDILECFLHTLRLHWVEFQNKFYQSNGIEFDTLNFGNLFN